MMLVRIEIYVLMFILIYNDLVFSVAKTLRYLTKSILEKRGQRNQQNVERDGRNRILWWVRVRLSL